MHVYMHVYIHVYMHFCMYMYLYVYAYIICTIDMLYRVPTTRAAVSSGIATHQGAPNCAYTDLVVHALLQCLAGGFETSVLGADVCCPTVLSKSVCMCLVTCLFVRMADSQGIRAKCDSKQPVVHPAHSLYRHICLRRGKEALLRELRCTLSTSAVQCPGAAAVAASCAEILLSLSRSNFRCFRKAQLFLVVLKNRLGQVSEHQRVHPG